MGLVDWFMTVIDSSQINESYKDRACHAAMAYSAMPPGTPLTSAGKFRRESSTHFKLSSNWHIIVAATFEKPFGREVRNNQRRVGRHQRPR
jgi:hypothetical protein